jgi:ferredoxin
MMSACKYDAMVPGNHDYSFGTNRLAELIDRHSLPVVMANCRWPDEAKPVVCVFCGQCVRFCPHDCLEMVDVGVAT